MSNARLVRRRARPDIIKQRNKVEVFQSAWDSLTHHVIMSQEDGASAYTGSGDAKALRGSSSLTRTLMDDANFITDKANSPVTHVTEKSVAVPSPHIELVIVPTALVIVEC